MSAVDFQARRAAQIAFERAVEGGTGGGTLIGPATETEAGLIGPLSGNVDDVLRGDGTFQPESPGGFVTDIDSDGAPINIGGALDGVHKRLGVATALTFLANAGVGTRVAVTPASTGTSTVTVGSGAVYRLPPTDGPAATGRFAPFDLVDYTEFECIANSNGASAQWDVWGVPAGTETTLAGTLDLNAQTIIPGAPVALALTTGRSYLAADSGKTFEVTGTGTAGLHTIPSSPGTLPVGWTVDIYNGTTSTSITIDGPGGPTATVAAGQVATVKVLHGGRIRVAVGTTTLIS